MNKLVSILITLYIVTILAWSGLVRAETVLLQSVSFNKDNYMLTLEGATNSSCGLSIKSEIKNEESLQVDFNLILELVKNEKYDFCITLVSPKMFSKVIDVRSLGLNPGQYNLVINNTALDKGLNLSYVFNLPQNSIYPSYEQVELSGVLTQSENGSWILTSEFGEITTLKTELSLARYLGRQVFVEGIEILHRMGPGFEVFAERSPLRATPSQKDPTVFLFTISTAMY